MQAYFSHSYRDVPINTYFSHLFDAARITLRVDQKTEVWCMAKLERYMFEMDGFVSIIPRRIAADESITYSPYIGRELMLARRARTPRILFVDDQVLNQYRAAFPTTAVPFFHDAPETERVRHVEMIEQFRRELASGGARPPRQYVEKQVTVIAGKESLLRDAASHVAAILRAEKYTPFVKNTAGLDEAFDDIDVFESLLSSELCVFVLGQELSHVDLFLAMAHAHCIPSVRLRHDPETKSFDPELSGVVRWKSAAELALQFLKVFQNYQSVFPDVSGGKDLQKAGTPSPGGDNWDPSDGPGLVDHIRPEDSYVSDRVNGVMRGLVSGARSRVQSDRVCRSLYDRIKQHRFYYTYEPVLSQTAVQKIRPPDEIGVLNCGTCIDFACLFAALLEAAHEQPVVVVTRTRSSAHAVAGYYTPDAVTWDSPPLLGDLRGAVKRGEVVLFETTGAVEAQRGTVAAETEDERKEGRLMLDYQTAKDAAQRLILRDDVELSHFIDVKQIRQQRSTS
jgi:hypothetical protein